VALGAQATVSLVAGIGAARLGCRLAPATRPLLALRNVADAW
jgi:hypothetical protein